MERILGNLALVGFIAALIVHLAAISQLFMIQDFSFVWVLHVGVFAVFVPFVFSARKNFGNTIPFQLLRELFPPWVLYAGKILMLYVVVNFIIFMIRSEWASPSILNGKFMLTEHGKIIREITEDEYHFYKNNILRGFSGHWLIFYFVPFAYFRLRKNPTP